MSLKQKQDEIRGAPVVKKLGLSSVNVGKKMTS